MLATAARNRIVTNSFVRGKRDRFNFIVRPGDFVSGVNRLSREAPRMELILGGQASIEGVGRSPGLGRFHGWEWSASHHDGGLLLGSVTLVAGPSMGALLELIWQMSSEAT